MCICISILRTRLMKNSAAAAVVGLKQHRQLESKNRFLPPREMDRKKKDSRKHKAQAPIAEKLRSRSHHLHFKVKSGDLGAVAAAASALSGLYIA